MLCFQLYFGGGVKAAAVKCVPSINEVELVERPGLSYMSGSFSEMSRYTWGSCNVTVRRIQPDSEGVDDILIDELDIMW